MTDTQRRSTPPPASLANRVIAYEVGMWRSLYRWVLRRPTTTEPGARTFGYAGAVTPLLGVLIGVSAVEVPLLDLILSRLLPWPSVRWVALALGIYGLLWMIGLLAILRVHPHVVGAAGLRVRSGIEVDLTLPWHTVAEIRKRYRSLPSSRTVQLDQSATGAVLHIGTSSQTAIDVVLRQPTPIPLPKGATEPVTELRFYADDADGLVALAREHLPADPPRP